MKKLITLFLFIFLSACRGPSDSGKWVEGPTEIVIQNNLGGNIQSFIAERRSLEASGLPVRIVGYCASSCTIMYSLPNACMEKGSSLAFHGASAFLELAEDIGNQFLSNYYRAGIKEKFDTDWKNYTNPLKTISRETAKKLDPEIKFCEDV